MIRLEFCGRLRPLAPLSLKAVPKPHEVNTLRELQDWLSRQHEALGEAIAAPAIKLVVNDRFVHDLSCTIQDGDEIAFLPPLSGG